MAVGALALPAAAAAQQLVYVVRHAERADGGAAGAQMGAAAPDPNTIPEIIKALGGPTVKIADDEYDKLFIVVPGTGTMTATRY